MGSWYVERKWHSQNFAFSPFLLVNFPQDNNPMTTMSAELREGEGTEDGRRMVVEGRDGSDECRVNHLSHVVELGREMIPPLQRSLSLRLSE